MSFPDDQVYCVLDWETYSETELRDVGAYEYSVHPSTEIMCVAWRVGTRLSLKGAPTHSWCPRTEGNAKSQQLFNTVTSPDIILIAHNALFEQVILNNIFLKRHWGCFEFIGPERFICTASLAASLALPRKLELAAQSLKLPVQKDMVGHKLMMKMAYPKKPSKKDPSTRHLKREDLERLTAYCVTDIDTEVELFLRANPLTPKERAIWILDQRINLRGFSVDRFLVGTILKMISEETENLNRRAAELSDGAIDRATKREKVLGFVISHDCFIPDLQKATVEEALKSDLPHGPAREMLEIRQAVSKTSTAKFEAFEARSRSDGRVRDILMYHGASTGRWSGTGVQIQNLPKPSLKDTNQAIEIVSSGDLELVRLVYGDPMKVFSDCIRGAIIASPGKVLDVADYNAIETRVLFWVAKHDEGLNAIKQGRDLYREQAARVFNKPVEEIAKDSLERFIGKGLILGCGYGMGGVKFALTCANQGRKIPDDFAKFAVSNYRTTHHPIPRLWQMIERTAIAAIQNPGKKYSMNYTSWYVHGDFLYCVLPSGRRLAYYGPKVTYELPSWGGEEKRPVIYHYGIDITKKLALQKTWGGTLVENVVQAIARDIMAEAMVRIERSELWDILFTVHDELVAERNANPADSLKITTFASLKMFCELMARPPQWAKDCPIAVDGFSSLRYRK